MGNVEIKGCCTLAKSFNLFHVRQTTKNVFENNFVGQITTRNYHGYPDDAYWLMLSVLCPKLVPPPAQDKYSVIGVWRYHQAPCGALVCYRVLSEHYNMAYLCEEATLGPHPVPYGPQYMEMLEMPFQPCASLSPLFSESNTFTLPRLRSFMDVTAMPHNKEAILQALHEIPIAATPIFRQSCYRRPTLRCKMRRGANWTSGTECCFVCYEKPAVVRFKKCKHVATCMDCAVHMEFCPLCRAPIGFADRLMLEAEGPFGSILLYNPIWIVKLSDWEQVRNATGRKQACSTLARIMFENQIVFEMRAGNNKNNLSVISHTEAFRWNCSATTLRGFSVRSSSPPHFKKNFLRPPDGYPT